MPTGLPQSEDEMRRAVRRLAEWDAEKKFHRFQGISAPFWRDTSKVEYGKAVKSTWALVIAEELESMDAEWQRSCRLPFHTDRRRGF